MPLLKSIAMAILIVFAPIQAVLTTVLALCVVDLFTGVLAARKRGEKITSRGLRQTIGKLVIYEIGICLGFLCETYLTGASIPIVKIIGAIVGAAELKSNLENLDVINGSPIFASLIKGLVKDKTDVQ